MKNRREFQEVKKISSKQAEQEARRFRVTIIDTKENKVMLDEETNAVMGCCHIPEKETKNGRCVQMFSSLTCGTEVIMDCLKNLDELQIKIMKTMAGAILPKGLADIFGGDNE